MINQYKIIGYDEIRLWLSKNCLFETNKDLFKNLLPEYNADIIVNRHSYAGEILEQMNGGNQPPEDMIGDIDTIIDSLSKDGYQLSRDDVIIVHRTLVLYSRFTSYLKKESMPIAYTIIETSFKSDELLAIIEKVFDPEYNIKDSA